MPKPVITFIQIQSEAVLLDAPCPTSPLPLALYRKGSPTPSWADIAFNVQLDHGLHSVRIHGAVTPKKDLAHWDHQRDGTLNEAEAAAPATHYPLISHWCSAAVASWSIRPDSADTAADMASRRCHDDCSQQGADKPAVVLIHKFHHVHTCIVSKPKSLCVYLHQDPGKTPYNGLIAKSRKHVERIQTDLQ